MIKKMMIMLLLSLVLLNGVTAMLKISSDSDGNIIIDTPSTSIVTQGNIKSEGYVEAKDFIVHSDGARELSNTQLREVVDNIETKDDGTINKNLLPDYYLTDDKQGIRMWRMLLDMIVNLARDTFEHFTTVNNRINLIESELCKNYPREGWSWCR